MSVWAMRDSDRSAVEFAATQAGYNAAKAYCGSNGIVQLYPGTASITIGSVPAGVLVIRYEAGVMSVYGGTNFSGAGWVETGPLVSDVRRFGAVADGSTDNAAAFQSAINFAQPDSGPGIVYVPPGHWRINSGITIPAGVTLMGAGKSPASGHPTLINADNLQFTGPTLPAITIAGSDVTLRGFYLTGRAVGSGNEIETSGTIARIRVEDVIINSSTTGTGLMLGFGNPVFVSNMSGVNANGCGVGIQTGSGCTSIHFSSCFAVDSTTDGWVLDGTYLALSACAADTNGLNGYVVKGEGVVFNGCGAESNFRSGWNMQPGTSVVFNGCRSHGNNTEGTATYPSTLGINAGSDFITATGFYESNPQGSTAFSVANWTGALPTSVAINNSKLLLPIASNIPAVKIGARGAAVSDASGGTTIDTQARTAINALLARMRTHGLIAP